jgi:hypothetical protein
MKNVLLGVVLGLVLLPFGQGLAPGVAGGQVPDSVLTPLTLQAVDQEVTEEGPGGITPRGAFIRGLAFPGWGHAKVGSPSRGGFYFLVQSTTGVMFFKTHSRLSRARDQLVLLESVERARLEAEGVTDPLAVEAALSENPEVADLRALEEVRTEQREDWIALGLFMMLLSGVDAYVSAHLSNFPAPVEIGTPPGGGIEVGFSLPIHR